MEEDTKLKQTSANGAAQTASVGNHEMLTYMKMPSEELTPPSGASGSPTTDLNFLDGLFDNSGSSDNGSEKGAAAAASDDINAHTETSGIGATTTTITSKNQLNASTLPKTRDFAAEAGANIVAESHEIPTGGATTASADASMKPVALPVNPLLSEQQQQQQQHATKPEEVMTNNLEHPGKPTTIQQHVENHGGAQGDQTNNATRTMSDVSSLTSSCGDGNTSPNLPYQSNEAARSFPNVSSNITHNQQSNNNALNNVSNQQNNQSFQSWVMQNTATSGEEELAPNSNYASSADAAHSHQLQQQQVSRESLYQPPQDSHNAQNSKRGARKRHAKSFQTTSFKQNLKASISEDEDDAKKRRRDRNMREQERSQKIANQILHLKELMAASNIPFKPDKYSTLVSVHEYIKSLQQRVAMVDQEQKKLVETITKTNELVTKAQNGPSAVPSSTTTQTVNEDGSPQLIPSSNVPISEEEEDLLQYIRGVDYKSAFSRINVALCVTRIDGRIIDCNEEFVRAFRLSKEVLVKAALRKYSLQEITPQLNDLYGKQPISLFNIISREDMRMIFEAMSKMLTTSVSPQGANEPESNSVFKTAFSSKNDHWAAVVRCNSSGSFVSTWNLHKSS